MGTRDKHAEEAMTAYQRWKLAPAWPWAKEGAVGDRFDLGAFFYLVLLVALIFFWVRAMLQPFQLSSKGTSTPAVRVEIHDPYGILRGTLTPVPTPSPTAVLKPSDLPAVLDFPCRRDLVPFGDVIECSSSFYPGCVVESFPWGEVVTCPRIPPPLEVYHGSP